MRSAFKSIRVGERRDTFVAFASLFALIASHSILETARDALFLARLPATRLPWVYVGIAVVSLVVAQGQARLGGRLGGRVAVTVWTIAASAVTLVFWRLLPLMGEAGLYALYVWSGVLTTVVLVHLWSLLGDIFTVTQAKRVYGVIGAGSVLGAIAGSLIAGALAQVVEPGALVVASGVGFLGAAFVPLLFRSPRSRSTEGRTLRPEASGLIASAKLVARQPYPRRVVKMLICAAACLTFADYLFKSAVAANVAPDDLASTLAVIYLVLNVASLVSQLGLVAWVVRRFDISVALSVLPILLLIGVGGMFAFGGLAAALIIKGADGGLRYSLHRTSTELLYVPLSESVRHRVKAFMDVVGQRGGQVLASLVILIAAAGSAPMSVFAAIMGLLCIGWLWLALDLRTHYLEIFRRKLRTGQLSHSEFPDLDVSSLETIIAALDSDNDGEVVAAMTVLDQEGKSRLVPALILYHPSKFVVERALSIFARARRVNAVAAIEHLCDHIDPEIRAAAIAARSVIVPDERMLRMRLSTEESADVRATIMVNLIASEAIVGSDAADSLDSMLAHGSIETKTGLAQAIGRRGAEHFESVLLRLASDRSSEVRLAAAEAMSSVRNPSFLPSLVDMLGDERTRSAAADALVTYGHEGLEALDDALNDEGHEQVLRWQLPRVIGRLEPEAAAAVLLRRLPKEWDGMVRYNCIRSLELLVQANPTLPLDTAVLVETIDSTVARAYRYLDRRLTLIRGARANPTYETPGHELLVTVLRDKERHSIGRLLRLLGLVHRRENFHHIRTGLARGNRDVRASGLELISNVVAPPLRGAVFGLVDDLPDAERLEAGRDFHAPLHLSYDELLTSLLASSSEIVQDITAYHIRELGLGKFIPQLQAIPIPDPAERTDIAVAIAELSSAGQTGERVSHGD